MAHRILSGESPTGRSLRMAGILGMAFNSLLGGRLAPRIEVLSYSLHPEVGSPQVCPSYVLVHVDVTKVGLLDLLSPLSRLSMLVHGVVRVLGGRVASWVTTLVLLLLAQGRGRLLLGERPLQDRRGARTRSRRVRGGRG